VAAELRRDQEVQVETVRSGLGELRVSVDGKDVVTTNRLLYTRPSRVVERVRAHLKELTSKTNA
jgi:hypothetical protein